MACIHDKTSFGFQNYGRISFISEYNIVFLLGTDGLSLVFLVLTLFTFPILFLSA